MKITSHSHKLRIDTQLLNCKKPSFWETGQHLKTSRYANKAIFIFRAVGKGGLFLGMRRQEPVRYERNDMRSCFLSNMKTTHQWTQLLFSNPNRHDITQVKMNVFISFRHLKTRLKTQINFKFVSKL